MMEEVTSSCPEIAGSVVVLTLLLLAEAGIEPNAIHLDTAALRCIVDPIHDMS
jgi:hypothetical protein